MSRRGAKSFSLTLGLKQKRVLAAALTLELKLAFALAFAFAFALALTFAFAPSPAFSLEQVKNNLVDEGRDFVTTRLFDKAIRHATAAIEKYSIPCKLDLSSVAQCLSQLKTDADCDALISNANNKAESYSIRGIAYASVGKFDLAAKDFDTALRSYPDSAVYICNKGRLLLKQGKLNEAETAARKAINIEPKMLDAHKLLGSVFNHQKKYKEANAEFNICRALSERVREDNIYLYTIAVTTAALKLNPNNAYVYRARAYVSWDEHKKRSEADYRKALELDPKCAAAYAGLAGIYVDSRNFKVAEPLLEKAVRLAPNVPRFWYNKGVMHSIWGQKQKALQCYEKAVKLEPDNPNYWRCRGSIKMKMGDAKGGLLDSQHALQLSPKYGQGFILKAQCLSKLSRFHEAIDAATKAIALSPRRAEAYQVRSYCYKCLDNMDLSLADLERASTLKPEDETIHLDTREVEALSGNLESAMLEDRGTSEYKQAKTVTQSQLIGEISSYTEVIEMTPTQPAPYYDRGILYAASGDTKKAIADLRSFLKYSNWTGKSSAYAASMLILFLRDDGQTASALNIVKEAKSKIKREDQIPFLNYLTGSIPETSMLATMKGSRYETKVRLMHAIDLYQRAQIDAARKEIAWVAASGDQAIDEFVLVPVYSKKMEPKQSGGSDKKR
ncbi:MAG: hypothetical protein C0469_16585 [Cyanobacteria bacterium DS2.3.42]|nr:hypothetical protein [Cyanobacteria bacterium DS2.3.42]